MSGRLVFLAYHWKTIEIKKRNGLTVKQLVTSFGRKMCDITLVQYMEDQKMESDESSIWVKLEIM